MVVDDEEDVITSLKAGLDNLTNKYTVIGANSGEECLNLLKKGEKPDLILLDIMMPGMNGWETFDRLKEGSSWENIPVIFLTALDDEETRKKGIETNTYRIKKPFEIREIKRFIDRVI